MRAIINLIEAVAVETIRYSLMLDGKVVDTIDIDKNDVEQLAHAAQKVSNFFKRYPGRASSRTDYLGNDPTRVKPGRILH